MPYYYAEPTGALLQHSNKAFKFKQRLDFKRYTFLRTRGFSIVIRHSLPTKTSFQKVYFFWGHPVYGFVIEEPKYQSVPWDGYI